MPAVLNLSNEVVKMRAEVKRVKVLLIRKLIRQISVLEKKKGNEADLERNRRRAGRLLEELHELRAVAPDSVTKAALQKDISFEKVCQNKEASLSDRAIARIATHPQFSKKIQSIKEAIKAFKEERMNAKKAEKQSQQDSDDEVGFLDDLKLDDGEEKEEEGKKMGELQEEANGPSLESKKTSLEMLNEQTNQCQTEPITTTEASAEIVSVPEEVVRMRKEVKRTRVLIISKLTQQVSALKKKKGQESEVTESQEQAKGILKEIQALRNLKLDQVTMTALQETTEHEKVLQNPQASPADRAIARIVTHSRFINKLQKVREAIKEERAKATETEQKKKDRQTGEEPKNKDDEEEENDDDEKEEEEDDGDDDDDEEDEADGEEEDEDEVIKKNLNIPSTEIQKSGIVDPTKSKDSNAVILPSSKVITTSPDKSRASMVKPQRAVITATNVQSSPEKSLSVSRVQNTESRLSTSTGKSDIELMNTEKPEKKQDQFQTRNPKTENLDEESDLDLSDDEEEKEYFDDSTEERFRKQSSYSEESDDDDFFVGKVSKFKKKKSTKGKVEEKKSEPQKSDNVEVASSKSQVPALGKMESVFCSALSKSSITSQNIKHGSRNDGPRPPRFQNQRRDPEGRMKSSQNKGDLDTDRRTGPFRPNRQSFKAGEQGGAPGVGKGKSQFQQHQNQNSRGPAGKISNPPQQSLHPSWEASRKRKEQQAQITAFQGKKIRFDDDD